MYGLVIVYYETTRIQTPPSMITTQKIIISTDPTSGQQYSQLIQEKIAKETLPQVIYDPSYNPQRRNKIGAIISTIITSIGVIMVIVGSFVADYASDYGVHLWILIILTFPVIWIYISHIFLLISVYRTKTHYGFSVISLVFACLTLLGGLGVLISFSFISESTIPENYSYSYSYYSAYSGYTHYTYTHQYGSWGEHNGFAVVSAAGGLIMIGQILAVIFSSFEIRRVPPSLKNPMIIQQQFPMMVPQQDYYPQISPPPTYSYSMNIEAPAYSSAKVQV